jgi:hypothetical protein
VGDDVGVGVFVGGTAVAVGVGDGVAVGVGDSVALGVASGVAVDVDLGVDMGRMLNIARIRISRSTVTMI